MACDPWRTRVLALEKELRELQEKYECQSLGSYCSDLRVMATY